MSHSLVTLLFVVSFMSTVPNASSAKYLKSSTSYGLVEMSVATMAEFDPACTAVKAGTEGTLADAIIAGGTTQYDPAADRDDILATFPDLFTSAQNPDDTQIKKIHIIISQEMFEGHECTTRKTTTPTDVINIKKAVMGKVKTMIGSASWSAKSMKSACLVSDIIKTYGTTFLTTSVSAVQQSVSSSIEAAVGRADIASYAIGTQELDPTVDTISSVYDSISADKGITDYIGSAASEDSAKRGHVLCLIGKGIRTLINPPFESGDEEKIKDHILYKYPFAGDCVMPENTDYPSISEEISGQGKTLPASVKWRVTSEVGNVFSGLQELQDDDKLKSWVAASKVALLDDTCGAKSAALETGIDETLRRTAYTPVAESCVAGDCGKKAVKFNCQIYRRLLDINTAILTAITRRATLRTEIRAALVKMTPSVAAAGGAVSFGDLVKAVKHVAADPTISGWVADNKAKYACVVLNVEAELITPTQPDEEPSGGGGTSEENKAPPATPATTAATTPKDGAAPPGISGGEIAGIVVLVIILVVLLAFVVYWFIIKDKS